MVQYMKKGNDLFWQIIHVSGYRGPCIAKLE